MASLSKASPRVRQAIDTGTVSVDGGKPEPINTMLQREYGSAPAAKRPMIMEGKKPEKSGGDATIGSSGKSLGN
jgi:hypothetical protein